MVERKRKQELSSSLIYVTNENSDNVSVINRYTGEVVETIMVGRKPRGVLDLTSMLALSSSCTCDEQKIPKQILRHPAMPSNQQVLQNRCLLKEINILKCPGYP